VTLGTRNDALWLAVSANQDHGLQRTNADKQRAVKAALRHPKAKDLGTREIAKHVGVSHEMVAAYRRNPKQLSDSDKKSVTPQSDGAQQAGTNPQSEAPVAALRLRPLRLNPMVKRRILPRKFATQGRDRNRGRKGWRTVHDRPRRFRRRH
jgi:hypothetical protein